MFNKVKIPPCLGQKSMSRYRRPKLALKSEDSTRVPSLPEAHVPSTSPNPTARIPIMRRTTDPVDSATSLPSNYAQTRRPIPQRSQTHLGATDEPQDYNEPQQSHEPNYHSDHGVYQHKVLSPTHSPPPVSLPIQLSDEETERILAEQKRKDLERLEATWMRRQMNLPGVLPKKFGPLDNLASIQRVIADGPPRIDAPVINPMGIQQGGGGVVPQTDAPISASNAPERNPEKWNKRYITLLSSGQVFVSKKSGMGVSDKDSMTICHLSDFDIYTPTAHQVRKVLKPPRKNCSAIKSQQKTAMFLSTENFVHFFCTDDRTTANAWYSAVQTWRSWYLVNKMGEGTGVQGVQTHRVKVSVDEDPYMIGSFKPLIDMDRFDRSEADDSTTEDENPKQVPFHLRNASTIAPLPRIAQGGPPTSYRAPPPEDQFASDGLLGRTYSVRQKAQQERENSLKNGSFVDGPTLINSAAHSRAMSMPSKAKRLETSNGANTSLQRRSSKAPQWNKRGKGHGVAAPSGVLLVEAANTPDMGLNEIPKANTVFRRDTTSQRPRGSAHGRDRDHSGSRDPFVKGGLVSGGGGMVIGGSMTNRGRLGYE
ncbi:hypothetical protein DID88_006243 [Monilinia fructigena]|uniref:PH domain-containing protein n=1 Tax=Monilinia fructigena TaxID=38457 RepID=A0A395J4H8_9HELO|nr:hypothetical protein DID88_006243 [Monilinia fructigena]